MEKNKFLKSETKSGSVVTSILISIAFIILVIVGLMSGNFLGVSVTGSIIIVFIASIFLGSIQISVFKDYKSQKKYLCADGIFYICLTVLVAITSITYVLVPNSKFDLRYFIFFFALVFAIWKLIIAIMGFKEKRFNAFAELILAVLWALSGTAVLLLSASNSNFPLYLLSISNYTLGLASVFYILFSYIFKEPVFLETPEAIELLQKDQYERQQRINRFNNRFGNYQEPASTESKKDESLEDKLNKLKELKDKNFITDEEYEKKKQQLLDKEL